jgi:hypothetical protein
MTVEKGRHRFNPPDGWDSAPGAPPARNRRGNQQNGGGDDVVGGEMLQQRPGKAAV